MSIGSPKHDAVQTEEGRIDLLVGSGDGLPARASFSYEGASALAELSSQPSLKSVETAEHVDRYALICQYGW